MSGSSLLVTIEILTSEIEQMRRELTELRSELAKKNTIIMSLKKKQINEEVCDFKDLKISFKESNNKDPENNCIIMCISDIKNKETSDALIEFLYGNNNNSELKNIFDIVKEDTEYDVPMKCFKKSTHNGILSNGYVTRRFVDGKYYVYQLNISPYLFNLYKQYDETLKETFG